MTLLYYYVLLVLGCEKLLRCEKYVELLDVFNGSKSKILVYNKKDDDPHLEIRMFVNVRKLYIWEMYLAQPVSMKWCLMVSRNLIV